MGYTLSSLSDSPSDIPKVLGGRLDTEIFKLVFRHTILKQVSSAGPNTLTCTLRKMVHNFTNVSVAALRIKKKAC